MQPEHTPFETGWFSVNLGKYRPHPRQITTYSGFDYDRLPPLPTDKFDGSLSWLTPMPGWLADDMKTYQTPQDYVDKLTRQVQQIQDEATSLNLILPIAFARLMTSYELQNRMPSATACYFLLSESFIPLEGGWTLQFYNDQQSVMGWHLFLKPGEMPGVLCALSGSNLPYEDEPTNTDYIFFTAPDFESFFYRYWLENHIWFRLTDSRPLDPEHQAYCNHYLVE
ncbi:MAG: hypothetical protein AAF125_06790 [Chloroflexota bacterium]